MDEGCDVRSGNPLHFLSKYSVYTSPAMSKVSETMEMLARRIERDLKVGEWQQCAVYEHALIRIWPLNEKDRETKIAQFAKQYGFRLRFYRKGMCAIFDKWPPTNGK
jgi:hypothetical protein